jgi:phosphonopyruvate decarboxylase
MLDTRAFGKQLSSYGYDSFSGVPCSFLKYLINYAINHGEYIAAPNEGDAVAIAAGVHLGGKKAVVLMQNSGLTNAVSPLTSLNYSFKFPVLGFVSLRGEVGIHDEPQHELMGKITTDLLDLMRVKWEYLSKDQVEAFSQLEVADRYINNDIPFFFVVRKNTFTEEVLFDRTKQLRKNNKIARLKSIPNELPSRLEVLEVISKFKNDRLVLLATTGKTGRELYEIDDSKHNLYMVGSLGCITSLGLGLAMTKQDKNVIVIDGDGSLLMRMGNMATNGYYNPDNMLHILLDNNSHDSTGGQNTVSHNVDFVSVATACGYKKAISIQNLDELSSNLSIWLQAHRLTFLHIKIGGGSKNHLGRPSQKPHEVKARIMKFIAAND